MSKCPVCGTYYGSGPWLVKECGGEGKCPAREAGERPSPQHVLCACNRRWLEHTNAQHGGHEFDFCSADSQHR